MGTTRHTDHQKWIELIRVRSSPEALEASMSSLELQAADIEASASGAETFFLKHAIYEGDLAVVLVWRTSSEPRTTREGLLVAERLQRLGSVEHAIWVPTKTGTQSIEDKKGQQ